MSISLPTTILVTFEQNAQTKNFTYGIVKNGLGLRLYVFSVIFQTYKHINTKPSEEG